LHLETFAGFHHGLKGILSDFKPNSEGKNKKTDEE
jgi:hypothetical protein